MKPTDDQIKAEIAALKAMKPKVRRMTVFGDDNHEGIEAQIDVLENYLSDDDIYDRTELLDDEEGYFTEHAKDHALYALQWMDGEEEEAPSEGWKSLVGK